SPCWRRRARISSRRCWPMRYTSPAESGTSIASASPAGSMGASRSSPYDPLFAILKGELFPLAPHGPQHVSLLGYTLVAGRALARTRHAGTLVLLGEPRRRKSEDAMRVGLQIPSFTWPGGAADIGPRLAQIGRTADEAGFASIWVMDHFFQIPVVGQAEEPMLEGYSALSYLAGVTQRARLGTLVTGVVYRYPGILVKTVTTLDVLSGGRAY